jgi:UTP--glucose-1-phosphate uridylyltransferase
MATNQTVKKAVIAAAGFGTRFLPQTKAMPKEMLPLVDKPIIQHIVEELAAAGIEDIIIVTGYHKRSIEDHFDIISADLRANLKQGGKTGAPLLSAAHLIGNEPFIYTFADDFVQASPSRFAQLLKIYSQKGGSVLTCVERDNDDDYKRYGYVSGKELRPGLIQMTTIVEKPGSREKAPSTLASVSGYLLEPAIFKYLEQQLNVYDKNDEFKIQDAMQKMIDDNYNFYAYKIQNGNFYDTGNKLEYLKTVVDFALMNDEVKNEFKQYLRDKIS